MKYDVIIIGGGLAGLACARVLQASGIDFILLEASDSVGGRVRTDEVDGFLLDRGFQVLQTAYPEARKLLDYRKLDLQTFAPGVMVRAGDTFHTLADPRRSPKDLMSTLTAPIGSFADRLRMVRLALKVCQGSSAELMLAPETSTLNFLKDQRFSQEFIDRFFTPFYAGTSLEAGMQASSRVFTYIFRMFALGDAALPALGMEEIPRQISATLPTEKIRLDTRAVSVENGGVTLENGESLEANMVVLATAAPATERLMGVTPTMKSIGETCFYFSADEPPISAPFLLLNGERTGPINNIVVPSLVSPHYAPAGKSLIAAVVLGSPKPADTTIHDRVRDQLSQWFGPTVSHWQHLKTYHIRHALPGQHPPTANPYKTQPTIGPNLKICGEYQSLPGIQWALLSGRRTADAVLKDLS